MKNTTDNLDYDRETIYYNIFLQYLPVAVFFGVAAIVGIIGNIIVVKFYGIDSQPKTSFTVLVRYMAYADLTVCLLLLFGAIEIGFNINFKFKYLCKVSFFLDEWSIYTSVWILSVISVDRYRKICQPFKWQMSERLARNCIPVILLSTFIMSIRNVIIYDIVSLNVTVNANEGTVVTTGYHCASTTDPDIQVYVHVFHWIDVTVGSLIFLIYFILYSLITHKLVKHRKSLKTWQQHGIQHNTFVKKSANKHLQRETTVSNVFEEPTKNRLTEFSNISDVFESSNANGEMMRTTTVDSTDKAVRENIDFATDSDCIRNSNKHTLDKDNCQTKQSDYQDNAKTVEHNTEFTHDHAIDTSKTGENVDNGNDKDYTRSKSRRDICAPYKQKQAVRRSEYQIAVMMLWVTIVFLLSLSSFFFASLMFRQDPQSELAIKPFTHFMIKCVFLNSVSNPVVYFIYNCTFRSFVKTLLSCRCSNQ